MQQGVGARTHITVDARMLRDAGVGTYLQNLLPRVAAGRPQWRFTMLGTEQSLIDLGLAKMSNVQIRACRSGVFGVLEQAELAALRPPDTTLFWAPFYNIPLLAPGPLMVTVHDLCHVALADVMGGPLKKWYAASFLSAVRRRAAGIAYPSAFTRSEFERLIGAPRGASAVTHLGVDDAWRARAPRVQEANPPYVLYVGNVKRHKNLGLLLRAFARIAERIPHRLYIVGRREGLNEDESVAREAAALGARVVLTGEVSKEQLREFVRGADVLVNPSLYEGFGLPPLEAMAAGCPVIVARAGSLPEVCGDGALYCDPRDDTDLSARLMEVLESPALRESLRGRGLERSREFSWDRCANETLGLMERALVNAARAA